MFLSQHRLGAPRSWAGGSASCWQRRAPRPIPSPCTTTAWTWKPSPTSATPCAIPSCELEYLAREPETKAADLAVSCCSHFPFCLPLTSGGPLPPAAPGRTPGRTTRSPTRTRRLEARKRTDGSDLVTRDCAALHFDVTGLERLRSCCCTVLL